jgi:hypothetical protein
MTAASGRHRLKVNLTEKLSMLFHAPSMHLACSTAAENAAPGSKTLPVPNGSGWDLKTLHPPKLLESIHTEMSLWSAYVAYAYKQTHQHTAGINRTNCVAIASVLSTHKRSGLNSTLHKTSTNHAKKTVSISVNYMPTSSIFRWHLVLYLNLLAQSFYNLSCALVGEGQETGTTDLINPAPAVLQDQLVTAALPPVEET